MLASSFLSIAVSAAAEPTVAAENSVVAHPLKEQVVRPEVVLIETDPWAMVIGADVPSFALYSDGQVIYRVDGGFRSVLLPPEKHRAILDAMAFSDRLTEYSISNATDQPSTQIVLIGDDKISGALIYGSLRSGSSRGALPPKIVAAYEMLHGFSDSAAVPWLPEKIEVMIWPYEYAPEASIDWPAAWPSLDDRFTVRRGDSYSLFLSSQHLDDLRAFLATRRERGAVRIGGKKWAVSWRLPFPMIN